MECTHQQHIRHMPRWKTFWDRNKDENDRKRMSVKKVKKSPTNHFQLNWTAGAWATTFSLITNWHGFDCRPAFSAILPLFRHCIQLVWFLAFCFTHQKEIKDENKNCFRVEFLCRKQIQNILISIWPKHSYRVWFSFQNIDLKK